MSNTVVVSTGIAIATYALWSLSADREVSMPALQLLTAVAPQPANAPDPVAEGE